MACVQPNPSYRNSPRPRTLLSNIAWSRSGVSRSRATRPSRRRSGDYIAFIDDDEIPEKRWLRTLFAARERYGADGVLGPVKPLFEDGVPRWIVKGGFYDRPCYETGRVLVHGQTRTGNVLIKEHAVAQRLIHRSGPSSESGEDVDFFRRAIEQGACLHLVQ